MTGWLEFAGAYLAFLAAHAIPARPAIRRQLADLLGERAYSWTYAAVSLVLLGWLVEAAARAPYVALWEPAPWQAHATFTAMAVTCLLAALALGRPNPFSFGGGDPARYDPDRAGIVGITRHPLLWAIGLWAAGHLIANGDLAHLLLFGGFMAMAVGGMVSLDRRARRRLGPDWERLQPRQQLTWSAQDAWRLLAAVLLFACLLLLHPLVIGVDPLAAL